MLRRARTRRKMMRVVTIMLVMTVSKVSAESKAGEDSLW